LFSITIPAISPAGELVEFNLAEMLLLLGGRARRSTWLCSGVESLGAGAEELMEYASYRSPIDGEALVHLSESIDQILAGVFEAFDSGEEKPWLKVRVVMDSRIEIYTLQRPVLEAINGLFSQAARIQP